MANKNTNTNKTNKQAMESFKMEVASELGVDLKDENLKSRDAGRVSGQMTKSLVEKAKSNM